MVYLALVSVLGLFFYLWLEQNSLVQKVQTEIREAEEELDKTMRQSPSAQGGKADMSLEEKAKMLLEKVTLNEREPFTAIRSLTLLANQSNMKNIKFTPSAPERYYTRGIPAFSGTQDEGAYSISVQMSAEGEFYPLIGFLRKVSALKRIVTIDAVQVSRDDKLLPQQRISIKFRVYSYLAPDASLE